jgi:hypothetical protein
VKGVFQRLTKLIQNSGKLRPGANRLLFNSLVLSDLGVAVAAINRSTLFGLKRYLCFFTALCTDRGIFLHGPGASAITASIRFPGLAAGKTTLRLIGITFLGKEFLLRCGEGKFVTAVNTLDLLVTKTH